MQERVASSDDRTNDSTFESWDRRIEAVELNCLIPE